MAVVSSFAKFEQGIKGRVPVKPEDLALGTDGQSFRTGSRKTPGGWDNRASFFASKPGIAVRPQRRSSAHRRLAFGRAVKVEFGRGRSAGRDARLLRE